MREALTDFPMSDTTITFTATPENHEDGQSAIFLARLDGEEADRITCDFDGTVYTAELDLKSLRVMKGYASALGLMFEKNTKGGSVVIQSIQFVSTEEAE